MIQQKRDVLVSIQHADDMDDETFLKHFDKRHRVDTKHDKDLVLFPNRVQAWLKLYRTWHEKLHDENRPHKYDHIHEDPSWMED